MIKIAINQSNIDQSNIVMLVSFEYFIKFFPISINMMYKKFLSFNYYLTVIDGF